MIQIVIFAKQMLVTLEVQRIVKIFKYQYSNSIFEFK